MSEVEISVGDRKYTIACNPGEEKDVLLASEELNKESSNILKSIGKVSDIKLLLMSGLMIAGRLKIVEEEIFLKSKEISELENRLVELKEEIKKIESTESDSQINEKIGHINSDTDRNSFEKILRSINYKLNSVIEDNNKEIVEDKELVNIEKSTEINSDQQELF